MSNQFSKGFVVILLGVFAAGCSGVSANVYKQQVDRVDQQMEGNAGYLSGTPQQPDRSNVKKTRANYYLEVEKQAPEPKEEEITPAPVQAQEPAYETSPAASGSQGLEPEPAEPVSRRSSITPPVEPVQEEPAAVSEPAGAVEAGGFTEYTIEKNDTLQKISKKFYGSYSKWSKIYEVNKDVIKDPNRLKPGVMIKVPKL